MSRSTAGLEDDRHVHRRPDQGLQPQGGPEDREQRDPEEAAGDERGDGGRAVLGDEQAGRLAAGQAERAQVGDLDRPREARRASAAATPSAA